MAKATLAFYVAEYGNIVDKAIAWYTKSSFSHVELVYDNLWYSTSPRDLEVRRKEIQPTAGHWVYKDIEIDEQYLHDFFFITKGRKYDWLGIFFSQFLPLRIHDERRYFCSEWCATAMRVPHANRYSPQDLYNYVMMGRKK